MYLYGEDLFILEMVLIGGSLITAFNRFTLDGNGYYFFRSVGPGDAPL
jgi:hypothetical protein